ncbi:MAG: DUF512 domain-containing protein [Desulfuromonas sp.]|nr:MAG: DUF512 domain-containing protein [Desulfuromonas sp.]
MLTIDKIIPDSSARRAGLKQGDRLRRVNGAAPEDLLDVYIAMEKGPVRLEFQTEEGLAVTLDVDTETTGDPGFVLTHPDPSCCGNDCLFCFVHQLPKGMRRSLYVKDEDYRFSYLYGSYVTLSNLSAADFERIVALKLSPLYISVHATDEAVRNRLLGRHAPPIMPLLTQLVEVGIDIHCQIVVCPGINDGQVLQRSIADLYRLAPRILSLAVVPVGLTRFRHNLPDLQPLTADDARRIVRLVEACQADYLTRGGSRFVFAADELYLQAGEDFPEIEAYEELWQWENGVGQIAQFRIDAEEVLHEAEALETHRVHLITGLSFYPDLSCFVQRLRERTGVDIRVTAVHNYFWGERVTVAGLLTAGDIEAHLSGCDPDDVLLIPDVMLKDDAEIFLDDVSLVELEQKLGCRVLKIESHPWAILDALEALADGETQVVRCGPMGEQCEWIT